MYRLPLTNLAAVIVKPSQVIANSADVISDTDQSIIRLAYLFVVGFWTE